MCLAHAPALAALALGYRIFPTAIISALVLGTGTVLFAGDLLSRHFLADRLFPLAAPTGGMLMIAGWLLVAAGAFFTLKRAGRDSVS